MYLLGAGLMVLFSFALHPTSTHAAGFNDMTPAQKEAAIIQRCQDVIRPLYDACTLADPPPLTVEDVQRCQQEAQSIANPDVRACRERARRELIAEAAELERAEARANDVDRAAIGSCGPVFDRVKNDCILRDDPPLEPADITRCNEEANQACVNQLDSQRGSCQCRISINDGEQVSELQSIQGIPNQDACNDANGQLDAGTGGTYLNCIWRIEGGGADRPVNLPEEAEVFQLPGSRFSLNKFANAGNDAEERAQVALGRFIKFLTGIIGSIALVVLITAGVLWMTSVGNADREKKAKEMMFWGVLGVIIILTSYSVLSFVFSNAF